MKCDKCDTTEYLNEISEIIQFRISHEIIRWQILYNRRNDRKSDLSETLSHVICPSLINWFLVHQFQFDLPHQEYPNLVASNTHPKLFDIFLRPTFMVFEERIDDISAMRIRIFKTEIENLPHCQKWYYLSKSYFVSMLVVEHMPDFHWH